MLIASSLAIALATTAAAPASSVPTMAVAVVAASDISPTLIADTLRETDAIWRAAGIRFDWQFGVHAGPSAALRVIIGGGLSHRSDRSILPLGWIDFAEQTMATPQIYLSHANAKALLYDSREIVGAVETMPVLQRDMLLSRAMGRALAHEIGHFLSSSKEHTPQGMMAAVHTAAELFNSERMRFGLGPEEQRRMVARFTSIYMAARD